MTRVWDTSFEVSPNGTALTTANTSYQAMVGGGTGTKLSSNVTGVHTGTFAAKFTSTATDTAAGAYTFTDRTQMYYRSYIAVSTVAPSTNTIIVTVKDNANANTVCQIVLTPAGQLRLRDSASSTLATSAAITANTIIEIEIDVTNIGGTPHCRARAQWGANLDTLTYNWDSGDFTTGTGNVGRIVEGSSTTQAISVWVDDSAGDDVAQPGPKSLVTTPPVSNAGPDASVEPFSTITLDGSGSTFTSPDTGVTYAWSQTGGTTVTLSDAAAAKPTFTSPGAIADANLTFSLTVTGNTTLTADASPDTVVITVLAATERWLDNTGTWKAMPIQQM